MYFRPETNTIFQTQSEVRSAFPDVSMPELLNDQIILAFGVFPVFQTQQPEYDLVTQGIRELTPELFDGIWQQVWQVYDLDPEQIAANEEVMRQQNKAQAESLLQATDWTATVDIADPQYSDPYLGNQPEFLTYRSAVRKIAVNPPITIEVWPTKPSEEWIGVTPQALSEAVSQEAAAV